MELEITVKKTYELKTSDKVLVELEDGQISMLRYEWMDWMYGKFFLWDMLINIWAMQEWEAVTRNIYILKTKEDVNT